MPGLIEAHIHSVSLANRPGYHTILENTTSIREVQEALAARRRKDVPEGQWITSMGGWHPNQWAEHRHPTLQELDEAVPDRPVLLYERFTGPCVTNSLGKKFFDAADAAPPAIRTSAGDVGDDGAIAAAGFAGAVRPRARCSTCAACRRSRTRSAARSTRWRYSAERRPDRAPRSGAVPDAGTAAPAPDSVEPRSVPDVRPWLALHREGRTIIRLQMNFLQNQNDPELPELKERLRNQFQFFGDDMLKTGAIGEWAAPLGSGAVWREAQRLVAQAGWRNENSVQNLAALTQVVEAYEAVNKEFDITALRWMVHHVPEVNADLLTRLKALGCGVQMAAFRWVTSSDPKVIVGPPFRTIVDHGIQAGITATACTSRR